MERVEEYIWEQIHIYLNEKKIRLGQDVGENVITRLIMAVEEIMFLLGEKTQSAWQVYVNNVHKLVKELEKVNNLPKGISKQLLLLKEMTQDVQTDNDKGEVLSLSISPSLTDKFKKICDSSGKTPEEMFKEMIRPYEKFSC